MLQSIIKHNKPGVSETIGCDNDDDVNDNENDDSNGDGDDDNA